MRIFYLFRRFIFRLSTDGILETLKEIIFLNRVMIAIEKNIGFEPNITSNNVHFIIVGPANYKKYQEQYGLKTLEYYSKTGAQCIMAIEGDECLGYQWVTQDNNFKDLRKLGIRLKDSEAYLFDLFVYPQYRGTDIPKMVARETFNHLVSKGVNKIYGFYFSDNIKALWWHRAILKCKEIKKVKIHRFLFFEFLNGRLMLTIW